MISERSAIELDLGPERVSVLLYPTVFVDDREVIGGRTAVRLSLEDTTKATLRPLDNEGWGGVWKLDPAMSGATILVVRVGLIERRIPVRVKAAPAP